MDAPPPPPPGDNALDADAAAASLAADGDEAAAYPQKKYFRSRAHCNPLSNNDGVPYPDRAEIVPVGPGFAIDPPRPKPRWRRVSRPARNVVAGASSGRHQHANAAKISRKRARDQGARRYPASPTALDWAALYPGADGPCVDFLDVGCGFGGLAVALAQEAPDKRTLALEIRPKVAEFVKRRVEALRARHPGTYANVACLRYNAMLHLPNLLPKRALDKIFFCFPDPHFKAKNHRRRIVSTALLAEYAYVRGADLLKTRIFRRRSAAPPRLRRG